MIISSKRAKNVALISLVISFGFFLISFLMGGWSGFGIMKSLGWLMMAEAFVCFVLTIQFHQRTLAEREKLDSMQTDGDKDSTAFFTAKNENEIILNAYNARLVTFEKWFLPILSLLLAIGLATGGSLLLKTIYQYGPSTQGKEPLFCAVALMAIAFVSFLISRYAIGLSTQTQWKPLRACGSFMFASSGLCFAAAIALAFVQFKMNQAVTVLSWIVPAIMLLIGVEMILNVIMDIYRPRIEGLYNRAAFDSRLLSGVSQPGKFFKNAAEAVDYQFGFKVSQTWFFVLLEKAILPLIIFLVVVLYFNSSIVIIEPDQQAVVERFGNPMDKNQNVRIFGPGLHFKWPTPFETIHRQSVKTIRQINIGFVPKEYKKGQKREPLIWGRAHYQSEDLLLMASDSMASSDSNSTGAITLMMFAVPVQYKIKDIYDYSYNYRDGESVLKKICYQQLTEFAASAKIEVNTENDLKHCIIGAGRIEATETLRKNMQKAADELALGIEITLVGLQGIHPPTAVAKAYHETVGSVQDKNTHIHLAHAERTQRLCAVAGTVEKANQLCKLANEYQLAEAEANQKEIKMLGAKLDEAFEKSSGEIFSIIRTARQYAFSKVEKIKSTGLRFQGQLKAYQQNPEIYKKTLRLSALIDVLQGIRKYIVVSNPNDKQIFIMDMTEKLTPSLYDIGNLEENE